MELKEKLQFIRAKISKQLLNLIEKDEGMSAGDKAKLTDAMDVLESEKQKKKPKATKKKKKKSKKK